MSEKNISIGEAYKFAWKSYKANIGYFITIFAIVVLINIALGAASIYTTSDASATPGVLLNLVGNLLQVVIAIGLIKIALSFIRGGKPLVSDLFSSYKLFLKFIANSILIGFIVLFGLMLFIIPGVIWSLKFSQSKYYIVDKNRGPIQALKDSANVTQGARWDLLGFFIVASLVNMLGVMFFFVGILVAAPVTMLATAHVYQQLVDQQKPEASEDPVPLTPPTLVTESDEDESEA